MSSSVIRDDVAYVGTLNDVEVMAIAIVRDSSGNWSTGAFYTFVLDIIPGLYSYVVLSRGFLGASFILASQPDESSRESILYLTWNQSESTFKIGNNYLAVDGDGRLTTSSNGSQFNLTPIDPAGYGIPNSLLAGVRYTMSTSSRSSSQISSYYAPYNYISNDQYSGLYYYNGNPISSATTYSLDNIQWMFIPKDPYYVNKSTDSFVPSSIPFPLAVSQCIYLQEVNGYGTSTMCNNWQDYAGFTNQNESQSIRYFYSSNGNCGETYLYNQNLLGYPISVSSSIGNCQSSQCNYNYEDDISTGIFSCSDPIPTEPNQPSPTEPIPTEPDESPPSEPDEPPPDNDDDRILSRWWLWALVVIFIIIAIIIVVIIIAGSSKKLQIPGENPTIA